MSHENDPSRSTERDALASQFGFAEGDRWMHLARKAIEKDHQPDMIGRYKVLERLGRGGQGTVFKVQHPETGRAIALKRLALGSFASTRERVRFQRELHATASLQHPCIVTLLGHDTIDEQPALLMEWVDGQPVNLWARSSRIKLQEILEVFALLCDAVAHAHRRGVLHRDLKPANVLITQRDGERASPKVLDFGLSRLMQREDAAGFTATEGFMGTPAYAPPEQASARWNEVDTRSDVYALGVMLYEAISLQRPFDETDLASLLTEISHKQPDRLSSLPTARTRGADAEIDAIVFKAIAKSPSQRYQSADALAADICRKLAGEAVLAHPPKLLYQARAFIRQHRTSAAFVTIAMLAVAGLAIVSTTLATGLNKRSKQLEVAVAAQEAAVQTAKENEALALQTAQKLKSLLEQFVIESFEAGVVAPSELVLSTEQSLRRGEFAAMPEIELGLLNLLARLACNSNDGEKADELIALSERSLQRVASDSAERALHLNVLGLRAEQRQDLPTAIQLYAESFRILESSRGRLDIETMRALSNLSGVTRQNGSMEEALVLQKDLLDRRMQSTGPQSLATASAWAQVAQTLRTLERHEESRAAVRMADEIIDWSTQSMRAEARRVARELARRGRVDGNPEMEERGLLVGMAADRLPRGTGRVLRATNLLLGGDLYLRQMRYDEALAVLEEALVIELENAPFADRQRVSALSTLAEELLRREEAGLGNGAESQARAAQLLSQALKESQCVIPPDEARVARLQAAVSRTQAWLPQAERAATRD
jgi:tetratricopeptide (TPR) repeat protein